MKENTKQFWKMLRQKPLQESSPLGIHDFYEYFSDLSNPKDINLEADDDVCEYLTDYDKVDPNTCYDELKDNITEEVVRMAIRELKGRKQVKQLGRTY